MLRPLHALGLAFLALLCVGLWGIGWNLHARAIDSRGWTSVEGRVVESTVVRLAGRNKFRPKIRYRYRIDRIELESNRIGLSDLEKSSEAAAREIARRFPVGRRVAVYYNAADPSDCMLEPGETFLAWLMLGSAGFLTWCCLHHLIRVGWIARHLGR